MEETTTQDDQDKTTERATEQHMIVTTSQPEVVPETTQFHEGPPSTGQTLGITSKQTSYKSSKAFHNNFHDLIINTSISVAFCNLTEFCTLYSKHSQRVNVLLIENLIQCLRQRQVDNQRVE